MVSLSLAIVQQVAKKGIRKTQWITGDFLCLHINRDSEKVKLYYLNIILFDFSLDRKMKRMFKRHSPAEKGGL